MVLISAYVWDFVQTDRDRQTDRQTETRKKTLCLFFTFLPFLLTRTYILASIQEAAQGGKVA
jgi:hypothetical protein